jgi:hypothetical protein
MMADVRGCLRHRPMSAGSMAYHGDFLGEHPTKFSATCRHLPASAGIGRHVPTSAGIGRHWR